MGKNANQGTVSLRKRTPRQGWGTAWRIAKILGFLALTFMAFDSAWTRQGPAIAVAAPLIAYLALVAHLVRRRRRRAAERR
jgi:hypothetical protein